MTTLRKIFVAILRWYGLMAPEAVPEPPPPAAPPRQPLRSTAAPLGYLIRRHVRTI